MNDHKLSVRLYGKKIGVLERLENNKMHFTYKHDAISAISLSMPIKEIVFDHRHCKPFFAGLLPELNRARRTLGRVLGINESDVFYFLKDMGHECAGAISFHELAAPVQEENQRLAEPKKLNDKELFEFIQGVSKRTFMQLGNDLRTILSGENDKAQICLVDGHIAIPGEHGLSTHVIKPALQDDESIFNEYFCLRIAQRLGLNVVDVSLYQSKHIYCLLLARFDRKIHSPDKIYCLHQEDFCQALGVTPARKRERDGGPGLKDVFHLMNKTLVPAIYRHDLMQRVIFNYIIGNNDAHGKHFAILSPMIGRYTLSPMYGVRCDYGEKTLTDMAMKIGKKYDIQDVWPNDWQLMCQEIKYSYPAFKKMLIELMDKSINAAKDEITYGAYHQVARKIGSKIYRFIEEQCERTIKRFTD